MREDLYQISRFADPSASFMGEIAGRSWCDGSYRVRRRNSPTFVFEYILKGKGKVRIGDKTFYPTAGDVYVIPAYSDHDYSSDGDDPWNKLWFNVKGRLVASLLGEYGIEGVYHYKNCEHLEIIFREGIRMAKHRPQDVSKELPIIIHRIILGLSEHLPSMAVLNPVALKARDYLDANLSNEISTGDLARHVAKSPSQVIRLFKETWGTTPRQYLINQRLEEAKQLLQGTVYPIKNLARELGFRDEFHFSSTFSKRVGMAPGKFRRLMQGN
ncbi:MAG: AraC family transcriptional regulator [Verrucomicrobia bacterium]|nr:AraC family transcriptional regulator [Verrucomicrobiota bacterium]